MKRSNTVIFLLLLFFFTTAATAYARPEYMSAFNASYPNSALVGNCSVCHWPHNQYESDWLNANQDFYAIELLNSDGDAFDNLTEITAGTLPGDATSFPDTPAPVNQPPVAQAGPDQTVNAGEVVTLNGSNSYDADDGIATFSWQQIEGTGVALSDNAAEQPSFTAPATNENGDVLLFELTVTDFSGAQSSDTVRVNVTWINAAPAAVAGADQQVSAGDVVTLDGSGSTDPDDGIASFQWVQLEGPPVVLSDPAGMQPNFTAPQAGSGGMSFRFQLTVTDHGGLQDSDTTIVNILSSNQPPVADAGPDQTVTEADLVTLDASGSSDPDDGLASYQWTQTAGLPVTLSDSRAVSPSFDAPMIDSASEQLVFELSVTDAGGLSAVDEVTISVNQNSAPSDDPQAGDLPSDDTGDPLAQLAQYLKLYQEYKALAQTYKMESVQYLKLYQRSKGADPEMAVVYQAKAVEYRQLSESAKLESDKYKSLYEQLKESLMEDQVDEDQHEGDHDPHDRDHHDDD